MKKVTLFFSVLALLVFFPGFTAAQESECLLQGILVDSETEQPIPGALISFDYVEEKNSVTPIATDANGFFEIASKETHASFLVNMAGYRDTVAIPRDACNRMVVYEAVSLASELGEVTVTGFRDHENRSKVAASIGYIDSRTLNATDQSSLQNSLNTVPGVIMESRGFGGSHRISIRGSALRAPFAVRNLKMYVDGIPFTSPDGQAPLEIMDAADVASIEVIKGPAGSVWGSGNGGVLLFKTKRALPGTTRFGTQFQAASYDSYRNNTFAEIGFKTGGLRISYVWQDVAGYRKQEFNHKNQVSLTYNNIISEKQSFTLYGTYYGANWGLPGSLTQTAVDVDPRQAVQYSIDNNAKLMRERMMMGASHSVVFGKKLRETTSLYYYSTDKENPYGTGKFSSGYKVEGADGFGGRTDWTFSHQFSETTSIKFNFGGEYQTEKYNIVEDSIVKGFPGGFKYFYDVGYINTMAFASTNFGLIDRLFIDAGASLNNTTQDVSGLTTSDFKFDTTATWKSEILPRIALSARVFDQFYVFRSYSYGNSNPTIFEMIDNENSTYNLSLRPELGKNVESGIRQVIAKAGLQYELSYYEFELSHAILSYSQVSEDGQETVTKYHNAGGTTQRGLEWSLTKTLFTSRENFFARIWTSGSLYKFAFNGYSVAGADFTGKNIPGVPLHNTSSGMAFTLLKSIQVDVMHYWFDKTPLDNANTTWSKPCQLLNARLGYSRTVLQHFDLGVYAGVNNILDTKYTSNYSLNPAGGKFYNPSAPVNYYGGISVGYRR